MANLINKELLKYLARLSKINLTPQEENKILSDLQKIIDYFNELQEVDTSTVKAMTGGTNLLNVFRKNLSNNPYKNCGKDSFPKTQDGFLEVPKVL